MVDYYFWLLTISIFVDCWLFLMIVDYFSWLFVDYFCWLLIFLLIIAYFRSLLICFVDMIWWLFLLIGMSDDGRSILWIDSKSHPLGAWSSGRCRSRGPPWEACRAQARRGSPRPHRTPPRLLQPEGSRQKKKSTGRHWNFASVGICWSSRVLDCWITTIRAFNH